MRDFRDRLSFACRALTSSKRRIAFRPVTVLLLLCAGVATSHAATYYVDNSSPSCSDTGPGTESQPYCTIGAAAAAHKGAGITILVKPGVYREQVTVPASGAPGDPFIFAALGGSVVVDGADDFSSPGQWVHDTLDVYLAAAVTWSPLQVFKDGARLTSAVTSPESLVVNSFTWVSGEGLYVNVGGDNPGTHELMVGRRSSGFRLTSRANVRVEGFRITRTESRGIHLLSGCTDDIIARDTVTFANSYGIQSINGLRHLIEACLTSDNNLHGIGLTAGATACTLRANESFRNADPLVRRANGIHLNQAPGNVIERNRAHDNQDSGFQFGTGADNNIAFNNRSWNNGDHGFDHLNANGTLHLHDVAFGNFKDGFSIEGTSPNSQLYNCIAVNNGLTTNEFNLWVNSTSTPGFISDYNVLWNSTDQEPIKYVTTLYPTLAGYQAASGQDAHSLQADPLFADGPGGDFRLTAGSPAIDSGISGVPSWPALDAEWLGRVDDPATANTGAGPVTYADRGALEFQTDQAPVVTAPATATVAENQLLTVDVTATDPDGDPITSLTAVDLPPGASFTPGLGDTIGSLTWTPPFGSSGVYTISFVASNALADTDTTVITVTDTDRPPVVTAPATATVAENELLTVDVTATDPDGDPITSLTAVDLPPGASFTPGLGDTTGSLTWTPSFGTSGVYTVSFVAANALSGADTTEITVTDTDRAPVVTAPDTASVSEDQLLTINVSAVDPDGSSIDSLTAAGLPPGATFIPGLGHTTGTMTWTPSFTQAGSYSVSFVAHNSLVGADTTSIVVLNTDRPPIVTAPATATVPASDSISFAVTALDPDGDPIDSLTVADLPPGATFVPVPGDTSGTFRWTPTGFQVGTYTVAFHAANGLVGSDSTQITVTAATTGVNDNRMTGLPLRPQVSPNPVRTRAHLRFALPRDGSVRVQVFDLTGRVVRRLMDEDRAPAAEYDLTVDAGSGGASPLSHGLYFYRIETTEGVLKGRFLVIK